MPIQWRGLSRVQVNYTALALPCIKTGQTAAKITLKRQHALHPNRQQAGGFRHQTLWNFTQLTMGFCDFYTLNFASVL